MSSKLPKRAHGRRRAVLAAAVTSSIVLSLTAFTAGLAAPITSAEPAPPNSGVSVGRSGEPPAPTDLTVKKSSTTSAITAAGQQVPYTFTVANSGPVDMSNIVVTDEQVAPALDENLTDVSCPDTTLPAAETMECTATYTVSQADFEHGSIAGVATVAGEDPAGYSVTSEPDTLEIRKAAGGASLSFEKGSSTKAITKVGQKVEYRFSMVNDGSTSLSNIVVTDEQVAPALDSNLSEILCPPIPLQPGNGMTCLATYTVSQADLDHGSITDRATVTALIAGGGQLSVGPRELTIKTSELAVMKSSTTEQITGPGQKVPYTFSVTNTGRTVMDNIVVTDEQVAPALDANLTPVVCPLASLAPAGAMDCTATYTVTQDDVDNGFITDTATVAGDDPSGDSVTSEPSDLTIYSAPDPNLFVVKSSTTTVITRAGQKVPYTFAVTNTGEYEVEDLVVTDTQTAPAIDANLSEVECPQDRLDPGASMDCTAEYTVSQADFDHGSITDEATVTGEAYESEVVSAPGSLLTIATTSANPALSVVKSSTTTEIATVGQKVPYKFAVTNTGGVTMKDVTVVDKQTAPALDADLSAVACPQTTLIPGGSMECTAEYTVSDADLKSGAVTDVATAIGKTVSDEPVESAPAQKTIKKRGSTGSVDIPGTGSLGSLGSLGLGSLGLGALGLGSLGLGSLGSGSLSAFGFGSTGSTGPGNPGTPAQPGSNPGQPGGKPDAAGQPAGPKGERPTAIDGGGAGLGASSLVGFGLAAVLLALGAVGAVVAIRRTR